MAYETIELTLRRPGARKRGIIDRAMGIYSRALGCLLEASREQVTQAGRLAAAGANPPGRKELLALAAQAAPRLNALGAQPFKDSLGIEFAALAAGYIAACRARGGGVGYPCVYTDEKDMKEIISALDSGRLGAAGFMRSLAGCLRRMGGTHPVYFGRYSARRGCCLMYDEYTGRFFARLTLLNAADRLAPAQGAGRPGMRLVVPGLPPAPQCAGRRNFIVVPLVFGRRQLVQLKRALEEPQRLRTARLAKKDGRYVLYVNIEYPGGRAENTMGVARGVRGGLHYTVLGPDGGLLWRGAFGAGCGDGAALAAQAAKQAERWRAGVVLGRGGGDGAELGTGACPVAEAEYGRMKKILAYRLPEKGLPAPIEVSARGLYLSCPECGRRSKKNRVSGDIFVCTRCGFAGPFEETGSASLASRPALYGRSRVPVYAAAAEDGVYYHNDTLGFAFTSPGGSDEEMLAELEKFISADTGCVAGRRRCAMLRRLRQAADIRAAVRIVRPGRD